MSPLAVRTGPIEPVEALRGAEPYAVPRSDAPVRLRLDGNEGPRAPRELVEALGRVDLESLRRYPDPRALEARIAARFGVDPARVIVTAGADDALDRALRCVLAPGRELVLPVPTFEMIERYARLVGADVVRVPWGDGRWPRAGVLASLGVRTACVALVSPNNPTGLEAQAEDLEAVADAAPHALVVVDQAYAEFGDVDLFAPAVMRPNVLLLRSLSKAFGLAGLRVGFAIGAERVVRWMRAVGQPYAVSGPSLGLADVRLSAPDEDVRAFVDRVREERESLVRLARSLGLRPLEGRANFVFLRAPDAAGLWRRLADHGVAVRAFPGRPGLEDALRITCPGDAAAFAELVAALRSAADPEGGAA